MYYTEYNTGFENFRVIDLENIRQVNIKNRIIELVMATSSTKDIKVVKGRKIAISTKELIAKDVIVKSVIDSEKA